MIRLLRLLLAVIVAVYVIVFAIHNRDQMSVNLVPEWLGTGIEPASAAVWVVLLLTLVLGIVLGSVATYLEGGRARFEASKAQGKVRRQETEQRLREKAATEAAVKRAAEKRAAAQAQPPEKKVPALPVAAGGGTLALPTR